MNRVLYDFKPEEEYSFDDGNPAIAVKEGDSITIIKELDEDWTLVKVNNKTGYVPANYIDFKKPITTVQLPIKTVSVKPAPQKQKSKVDLPKVEIPKIKMPAMPKVPHLPRSADPDRGTLKPFSTLQRLEPVEKTDYLKDCASAVEAKVKYAIVVQYFKGLKGVWTFLIETESDDGVKKLVYRTYQDFYDLQRVLLCSFPGEAGISGTRVIPTIPGPVPIASENTTQRRAAEFAVYCKEIFDVMPENISKSKLIQDFFGNWTSDDYYNKKYAVKEGMGASDIVAPWNQMRVGSGLKISNPEKGKRALPPTTQEKVEKPKESKEKKKEDPNELKAPTNFQPKEQKTIARERKKSSGNTADPILEESNGLKFENNGKIFMLTYSGNLKETLAKVNSKLGIKISIISYLDGKDVIEISDEDDWQTALSLTPKPKFMVK